VAAVDEDRELDRARPAEVDERIERRPYGAPRVEHVIDDDDRLTVDAFRRHLGAPERAGGPEPEVIPVHGDVQRAPRDHLALELAGTLGKPPGERHSPRGDPEQHDVTGAMGTLQDLVRDPGQRSLDLRRLKDPLLVPVD
jgi:hypothetical protein